MSMLLHCRKTDTQETDSVLKTLGKCTQMRLLRPYHCTLSRSHGVCARDSCSGGLQRQDLDVEASSIIRKKAELA